MTISLTESDSSLVQALLERGSCSIHELQSHLRVTAGAVRQKLLRLMAAGYIDRTICVSGRGRPNHQYALTAAGRKLAGNNLADLAGALWQELQLIGDDGVRKSVMEGLVRRLADSYSSQIDGQSIQERLESVARLFALRNIPASVEDQGGQPILKILSCPYPELANANHEVCDMEQRLFSQVTGENMQRRQCRQDGDGVCCYQVHQAPLAAG
jgi:predicted ArsR family transcriptional regulator